MSTIVPVRRVAVPSGTTAWSSSLDWPLDEAPDASSTPITVSGGPVDGDRLADRVAAVEQLAGGVGGRAPRRRRRLGLGVR